MSENRCICCGEVIPEGGQVCRICSDAMGGLAALCRALKKNEERTAGVLEKIKQTMPGETICLNYDDCQDVLAEIEALKERIDIMSEGGADE